MKSIFLSLFLLVSIAAAAQTTEDSVKAAVNLLFTGIKTSDPVVIRASFADSAVLQTIQRGADGKVAILNESIAAFAESIGKRDKGSLDEQIVFESIRVDGDLASVWTPYKFFFKGQFSHCGVNSFQLVRVNGKWVIQYIIDTRRKGC